MKCRVCNKEKLKVVYNEEEMVPKAIKMLTKRLETTTLTNQ
jgi:hypothetical protein